MAMAQWMEERSERLREFFGLGADAELVTADVAEFEPRAESLEGLRHFHMEWHVIPSAGAVPLDDAYFSRLYPTAPRDFAEPREHKASYLDAITRGH